MVIVLICLCYAFLGSLAISVGYHRLLCHRSFKTHKWIEYILVAMGLPTGTPVQWVAVHRVHHAFTDREGDPHSVHVQGFWYAQVGKYFRSSNPWLCFGYSLLGPLRFIVNGWLSPRFDREYYPYARDILANPIYSWLTRPVPYMLCSILHLAVTFVPMAYFFGITGVLALSATTVIMFNLGDAGDTLVHLYGKRLPRQDHRATNLWWYAILTLGDGWHANHHTFPRSARHGLTPWQVDGAYLFIKTLERLGLAWDVQVPTPEEIATVMEPAQEHRHPA